MGFHSVLSSGLRNAVLCISEAMVTVSMSEGADNSLRGFVWTH